ncbi:MAG: LacI family DNA-binding transcriptional regulator [Verrucomicrobiota bacterium]
MAAKGKKKRRTNDRVTLGDIAKHCEVSKATVSRVLNDRLHEFPVTEKMIQRVKSAAEELDYRPNRLARAIRSQRTHLIGLSDFHLNSIMERTPDRIAYEDQVKGEYISTITNHPKFKDYDLVIHCRDESTDQPLKPSDFKHDLLDGMVYLNPSDNHTEFLDVASKNFPIVVVGHVAAAEEKVPCVDFNNRETGKRAVEHLIEIGRRNILILIPERLKHLACLQDRLQGYHDALTQNGIQVSDKFIHHVCCTKDGIAAFFRNLPCLGEVDAIMSTTDDLAAFCIEPLTSMGYRIPEDIALIGFDNSPICQHTSPTLSSVNLIPDKQVYAAIDLLLKILNKEVPYEPGFHEIETELVIRESTVATRSDSGK